MILDQQSQAATEGVTDFPDWVFSEIPKPTEQIKNTVIIGGKATTNISIGGDTDD
jgi:hypothetical protein